MPSVVSILLNALFLGGVTLGEVCKCVSSGVSNPSCDMIAAVKLRQDCVLTQVTDSLRTLLAVASAMGIIQ